MLSDMERCASLIFHPNEATGGSNAAANEQASQVLSQWNKRLDITEASYKTRESILYLHQILLHLLPGYQGNQFQVASDNVWLKIAKTARK